MAWAPGKGMKGKEYKDYWDVDLGSSYIPYEKIDDNFDIELLEDGGMIYEDTVPDSLKGNYLLLSLFLSLSPSLLILLVN